MATEPLEIRSLLTDVSGAITTDTVWTAANSPYILTGDVRVASSATLTIEPGVVVQPADDNDFNNDFELFIGAAATNGTLIADQVTFQAQVVFETTSIGSQVTESQVLAPLYRRWSYFIIGDGAGLTLEGNNFHAQGAITFDPYFAPNLAGNTFDDGATVNVRGGTIDEDVTWPDPVGLGSYVLLGDLTIQNAAELTLVPGVHLIPNDDNNFNDDYELFVGSASAPGTLIADQTDLQLRVVFQPTSLGSQVTNSNILPPLYRRWSHLSIYGDAEVLLSGNNFHAAEAVGLGATRTALLLGNNFDAGATVFLNAEPIRSNLDWLMPSGVQRFVIGGNLSVENGATLNVPQGVVELRGDMTVQENATFVLQPGVRIEPTDDNNFNDDYELFIGGSSTPGRFLAQEVTIQAQVVFRSTAVQSSLVVSEIAPALYRRWSDLLVEAGAEVDISHNAFTGGGTQLYINAPSNALVKRNNFAGTSVELRGNPIETFDLTDNNWGTIDPALIENKILHKTDDANRPLADFDPFVRTNSINNVVWNDLDRDGQREFGEPGVAGVTVAVKQDLGAGQSTTLGTTVTDANGVYRLENVTGSSQPINVFVEYTIPNGSGLAFTRRDRGSDVLDSDVDPATGRTPTFIFNRAQSFLAVNAGLSAAGPSPGLSGIPASASYAENSAPKVLAPSATVTDPDTPDYEGGSLRVALNGGTASDRLAIRNQGTANGQISITGNTLFYTSGGVTSDIGTFAGGQDGFTPLIASLNGAATPAAVQALLRNVTFQNVSDTPPTAARSMTFQLTDAFDGVSNTANLSLVITAVNDVPVVANFGTAVTYVENAAPLQILANTTTVTDPDSPNFSTGTLKVNYTSGGTANDRLAIRNDGVAAGQIGVSGSNVTFGGTVIGTFTGGNGTTPLVVTFNPSSSPAAAQALLRAVTFSNVSDNPATANRVVRFELKDGDGGTTSLAKTLRLTVANDAPVIANAGGNVGYTENAALVQVFSTSTTVADPDSPDLTNGRLTVTLANALAEDRLTIRNVGTGVNQVSVSGSNVLLGGVVIGTFTGGTGATPLVVTFNAAATPAKTQFVLRNVLFSHLGDNPTNSGANPTRGVSATLTDGDGGTSGTVSKTINVTAKNDAPVINAFDAAVTYTENGTGVLVDANAAVLDPDSANFAGGNLTVNFAAGGQATDRLFIRHQGTAAGQIGVSGNNVTFGGTVIGTFTGGVGKTALVVSFNASSSPAAAQALLRNVLFRNTSDTPPTVVRTVRVLLRDGDGGVSTPRTKSLNVLAVNDAPVIGAFDTTVTYKENTAPILVDGNATVADLDSANFATGALTAKLTANGQAADVLSIRNQGTAAGQIGVSGNNITFGGVLIGTKAGGTNLTDLVVTLNANATRAATQALLRNLLFQNTAENPSSAARTIAVTLADGDGATSAAATKSIAVVPVNDAPVVGNFTLAATYIAGANATRLAPTATVSDVDSANFAGGSVVLSFLTGGAGTNVLGVRNEGSGAGQIGVSGSNVTFGGVVIGTLPAGAGVGGTPLTVNLNSAATVAAVQALVRNLNYRSTAANPTGPKTLRLALRDGDGGVTTADKTLNITPAAAVASSAFANYDAWARELEAV